MLFAQTAAPLVPPTPFFPPWYFWLFVLALVITIFSSLFAFIFFTKRTESAQKIRERELTAHLIEVMLTQRKMSPEEIDRVLNSYWRLGSNWHRFRQWFSGGTNTVPVAFPDAKLPEYKS